MSYKVYIYAVMLLLSAFALSGINFTNMFKKDHVIEAKILMILCMCALAYLSSSFIITFIEGF